MVPAAVLLSFAILAIIVARQVRRYHALKDFGGHWSAGWSRLWLLKTQSSGRMNKIFTDINKEYGMCNFFPLSLVPPSLFALQLPCLVKRWRHRCHKNRSLDEVAQTANTSPHPLSHTGALVQRHMNEREKKSHLQLHRSYSTTVHQTYQYNGSPMAQVRRPV